MAGTQRRATVTLADKLFAYPQGYDFYQAVRLLKALNFERTAFGPEAQLQSMGYDFAQAKEVINFGVDPALRQPQGEITQLTDAAFNAAKKTFSPIKMQVSFMGLTGPSGV
jgi:predicted component of type VI protein secretion system